LKKKSLLLLGLVTLLVFPIPAFIGLYFIEGITPIQVMQFNRMDAYPIALGIIVGMLYAVVALGFMMAPVRDGNR
jgi:zinc transporter ZupT